MHLHFALTCVFLYPGTDYILTATINVDTELTITSTEGQTTSPQPAALLLAPSNQVNGTHFTDVIKKTNYHKLVIYHPHEDYHPCPGTSPSITKSVSPLPSHTLPCLSANTSYGWTQLYISHSLTQSDSHTVGHLWERLVWVIKAQCSAHRESEEKRRTIQCD